MRVVDGQVGWFDGSRTEVATTIARGLDQQARSTKEELSNVASSRIRNPWRSRTVHPSAVACRSAAAKSVSVMISTGVSTPCPSKVVRRRP